MGQFFDIFTVTDKEETNWRVGNVHARILKDAAHWQVFFSCPLSQDERYDVTCAGEAVYFKPFLPETPFVAFLPQKFYLAPDMEAGFKIAIPAAIQMGIGRLTKIEMQVFPRKFSFEGMDTINGELCTVLPDAPELLYAGEIQDDRAGASLAEAEAAGPDLFVFSEAIIRNHSKQVYAFDRIMIYPETIDIFAKNGSLVGDLVIIDYIEVGVLRLQTPSVVPIGYQLLTTAGQKNGVGARIVRQSAGFFKNITSMKLT
jgi:hypothetical protein